MSKLKWSEHRDKYVKDIIDVALFSEHKSERGYMNFQKRYVLVLNVSNNIEDEWREYYPITEIFWWYAEQSKENLFYRVKKFIEENKDKNITVKDLVRIEARETTFD